MEKEGGNRERMRKCRESISLHFLIFSPFPPHFLILSSFPRSPAARLQRFVQPWSWVDCLARLNPPFCETLTGPNVASNSLDQHGEEITNLE